MKRESIQVGDIKIYPFVSVDEVLEIIAYEKKILVAVNYQKITHLTEEVKTIINTNIGYAEGAWLAWALRKKGFKDVIQIPGCELWLKIVERYHADKSIYLIGGTQDTIVKTVEKLKREYPAINIINYRNGYFTDMEKEVLFADIKEKKPDIVFVAMGSPKQEQLMQEMLLLHPALYQGLGGSFDVYVNNVPRAPHWWIKHKLEWVYRMVKQPSRIRRLKYLPKYLRFIFSRVYDLCWSNYA